MEDITEYRCQNCGSSHLIEENDFIVCQACGSKFKDNTKKTQNIPQITVQTSQNTNTKTNNTDFEDTICCCKGIFYIILAYIIYAYTYEAIGAWYGLLLGIIITIIVAYIIHRITKYLKK